VAPEGVERLANCFTVVAVGRARQVSTRGSGINDGASDARSGPSLAMLWLPPGSISLESMTARPGAVRVVSGST
jgi:hypothetical protein